MIEKAEDPEKMIKQLIREMDEVIISFQKEVAKAIAAEKKVMHRIEEAKKDIESWQENTERAVKENNDSLAREAISKMLTKKNQLAELKIQHKKALTMSHTMKEQLQLLEQKVDEA